MKLLANVLLGTTIVVSGIAHAQEMINIVTDKDPMGIAGKYECKARDSHDGEYAARFMLVRDENASDVKADFGTYRSVPASGEAKNQMHRYMDYMVVQGDNAAMYFQHTDNPKNQGVTLLTVSKTKAEKDEMMTTFSGPYFKPLYHRTQKVRTGYGTLTCMQVNHL